MFISNTFLFIIQFFKFCIHFLSYSECYKKLLIEFHLLFSSSRAYSSLTAFSTSPEESVGSGGVVLWYYGDCRFGHSPVD